MPNPRMVTDALIKYTYLLTCIYVHTYIELSRADLESTSILCLLDHKSILLSYTHMYIYTCGPSQQNQANKKLQILFLR